MQALTKIKAYAQANGKTPADLLAMGKRAVVNAAGLTRQEARTIGKAIKRWKQERAKAVADAKLATITTKLQAGTLPALPNATVEELVPGQEYKVILNNGV